MEDAQEVTISPLRTPAWKSSYAIALANQRNDQAAGGKDRSALSLNAASVTTNAGNSTKPRMAVTASPPRNRDSRRRAFGNRSIGIVCERARGISMQPDSFEWAGGRAHQRQHRKGQHEPRRREACCKREVEARKTELIDQIRDHVDPATADQLRGRERAEGPCERGGDACDDAGRGERERHR